MVTTKQKSVLKNKAHHLNPLVHIGKEGISDTLIASTNISLHAHQLIKCKVLKSCPVPLVEIALDLSAATKADIVQIIGRVIVLYKRNKDLEALC